MPNIYIEQQGDGSFEATRNGKVVATGTTQEQAKDRARRKHPDDPCLAERVRNTDAGSRDKWRRIY